MFVPRDPARMEALANALNGVGVVVVKPDMLCIRCHVHERAVSSSNEVLPTCLDCFCCDVCGAQLLPDDPYRFTGLDVLCSNCTCGTCRRPLRRFGLTLSKHRRTAVCRCNRIQTRQTQNIISVMRLEHVRMESPVDASVQTASLDDSERGREDFSSMCDMDTSINHTEERSKADLALREELEEIARARAALEAERLRDEQERRLLKEEMDRVSQAAERLAEAERQVQAERQALADKLAREERARAEVEMQARLAEAAEKMQRDRERAELERQQSERSLRQAAEDAEAALARKMKEAALEAEREAAAKEAAFREREAALKAAWQALEDERERAKRALEEEREAFKRKALQELEEERQRAENERNEQERIRLENMRLQDLARQQELLKKQSELEEELRRKEEERLREEERARLDAEMRRQQEEEEMARKAAEQEALLKRMLEEAEEKKRLADEEAERLKREAEAEAERKALEAAEEEARRLKEQAAEAKRRMTENLNNEFLRTPNRRIILKKNTIMAKFGFTIAGGDDVDGLQPHVETIDPVGLAAEGGLQLSDMIITINGHSYKHATFSKVKTALNMAEKSTQLILTVHRHFGMRANNAVEGFNATPRLTQQRFKAAAATTEDLPSSHPAESYRHGSVGNMVRPSRLKAAATSALAANAFSAAGLAAAGAGAGTKGAI